MSKGKAWAFVLAMIQLVNALAAGLTYISALELPPGAKDHVLVANLAIAAVTGGFQAFSKSLADTDKDGTPDLFDDTPNGPRPKKAPAKREPKP